MKEKLTNNIGLKLLSVLIAFVIWLTVVNISNPEVSGTKKVLVEVVNSGILSDAGKTYEIDGSLSVSVTYHVKARDDYKIKSTDFYAYIDLGNMYEITGSVPIEIEVVNNEDLMLTPPEAKPSVLKVKVEDMVHKTVPVNVFTIGEAAEGFTTDGYDIAYTEARISGPESIVGFIKSAGIEINIDGASSNVKGTETLYFYDENKNRVSVNDNRFVSSINTLSYDLFITEIPENIDELQPETVAPPAETKPAPQVIKRPSQSKSAATGSNATGPGIVSRQNETESRPEDTGSEAEGAGN